MIVDYDNKYDEEVKDLLIELQEHIKELDIEGYNILTKDYKDKYFDKTIDEINNNDGKMLLYKENDRILGLIVGLVNNEVEDTYDFKAPKRGRITELIISKDARSKGIGETLLNAMEKHLKNIGCEAILLGVFAYNTKAINFYEKHGYHTRTIDMIKVDN